MLFKVSYHGDIYHSNVYVIPYMINKAHYMNACLYALLYMSLVIEPAVGNTYNICFTILPCLW
jgi:hypothetical protein